MTPRALQVFFAAIQRRVANMLARGVVRMIDSAARTQLLQVDLLDDETRDGAEHLEPYGFTAHPHPGAECFVAFPMGSRDHPIVLVAGDRRYRIKGLAQGEVAFYDDQGQKVVIYRDRIEVEAPKVVVLSDDVHLGAQGGPAVARIGDLVDVGSGSSAGQWPIVSGSAKVTSA